MKPDLNRAEQERYNRFVRPPDGLFDKSGSFLSVQDKKKELRKEILYSLSLLPPSEFEKAGYEAAEPAKTVPYWKKYNTILLFMSLKNEISTLPLIKAAFDQGKTVFIPMIKNKDIRFFMLKDIKAETKKGKFGIEEPLPENPLEKKDFPVFVFTPGLAFEKNGNRLGRGGGFYDRFFSELDAQNLEYESAGICLKKQIMPSLPMDKWDKPVKRLIY